MASSTIVAPAPRSAWSSSPHGLSVGHGMNVVLQNDLARRVIEAHRGKPATISQRPPLLPGIDAPMSQQKAWRCCRALPSTRIAVARALTKSRIASCAASGTHTAVSSPLRCSLASIAASRRSVFTRSPAFIGISEGPPRCSCAPVPSVVDAGHIRRVRLRNKNLPAGRPCQASSPAFDRHY